MTGRIRLVMVVGICGWVLGGCASYYTRQMSEAHKDAKIAGKSFAILPVLDIDYQPPSDCFSSGNSDGSKYEGPWVEAVEKDLKASFKTQTFKVYSPEELRQLRIEAPSLYSAAADEIAAMGVRKLEASPDGPPKVSYKPTRSGSVRAYLQPLHDSGKVDYVILLVQPKMTGRTDHQPGHYNAAPGAAGGGHFAGGSTTTTYTSDIRFGVWSAETGELIYASGAINASSGFCLVATPQQGSINGTATDIATQLKALIARLLDGKAGPVEIGMSAGAGR